MCGGPWGVPQWGPAARGCQPGLEAHLEVGLGAERAHQPVQSVKPQLDVEAPLLLRRDVCDAPGFGLRGQKVG